MLVEANHRKCQQAAGLKSASAWGEGGGFMRRTESSLAHEGVRVLERRRPPLWVVEIVGEKLLRNGLLAVPAGHAPQPLQHRLLSEGQVEEAAVDRVLHLVLGVFVARDDLELGSLCKADRQLAVLDSPIRTIAADELLGRGHKELELTTAAMSVSHMNMPLSRASSHKSDPWCWRDTKSTRMSWLDEW